MARLGRIDQCVFVMGTSGMRMVRFTALMAVYLTALYFGYPETQRAEMHDRVCGWLRDLEHPAREDLFRCGPHRSNSQ